MCNLCCLWPVCQHGEIMSVISCRKKKDNKCLNIYGCDLWINRNSSSARFGNLAFFTIVA